MPKKMGRPTDDPKPFNVTARINAEDYRTLTEYCERKGILLPQGIREGIRELKNKK